MVARPVRPKCLSSLMAVNLLPGGERPGRGGAGQEHDDAVDARDKAGTRAERPAGRAPPADPWAGTYPPPWAGTYLPRQIATGSGDLARTGGCAHTVCQIRQAAADLTRDAQQ